MIDAYGNIMHVLVVDEPHQEIAIRVIGEAETMDTAGVVSGDGDPLPVGAYRGVTPLTQPDAALRAFAEPLRPRFEKDRLDGLHDILDLALIEAGRLSLDLKPAQIHDILFSVSSLARDRARKQGISLSLDCAPNIGAT